MSIKKRRKIYLNIFIMYLFLIFLFYLPKKSAEKIISTGFFQLGKPVLKISYYYLLDRFLRYVFAYVIIYFNNPLAHNF